MPLQVIAILIQLGCMPATAMNQQFSVFVCPPPVQTQEAESQQDPAPSLPPTK